MYVTSSNPLTFRSFKPLLFFSFINSLLYHSICASSLCIRRFYYFHSFNFYVLITLKRWSCCFVEKSLCCFFYFHWKASICFLVLLPLPQCWQKFCCRNSNVAAGLINWSNGFTCTALCVNLCRKGDIVVSLKIWKFGLLFLLKCNINYKFLSRAGRTFGCTS